LYAEGKCDHICLIAFRSATAEDTVDLGRRFSLIKNAARVSVTGTHIAVVTFSERVANQTCSSMTHAEEELPGDLSPHPSASSTRSVVIDFAARQPVIIRENTSMHNAT
jgi:hypothetical protein